VTPPRLGGAGSEPLHTVTGGQEATGNLLARNAVLNLVGWILPMGVALLTVPLLIRGLGTERFGVLTVGWVIIGYFGLFDFGLGRALTKLLAERIATDREAEIPELVWTALFLMLVLGVIGAVVLVLAAPRMVADVLKVSAGLEAETRRSFQLLAFSLPWVISTAGLLGALEASQRFGLVNAVRVPSVLFNYLAPLAVLPFTTSLVPVIGVLVLGRILSWLAHLVACLRAYPMLGKRVAVEWSRVGMLARFGGWMTVSNTVSPLMTHLDRFLIGALISMEAVAYYASPYELVTRLWLIPGALMGVFFPAFAATYAADRARTSLLFGRAVRVVFVGIFPIALLLVVWAPEGLRLWLGAEFEQNSTIVLRWLALGVFVNCLAQVPFALIQGLGRPDLTAKLHLTELPMYAVAIWFLSRAFGLEGVAIAWVLRITVDTVALFAMADRFLPGRSLLPRTLAMIGLAAGAFAVATFDGGIAMKSLFCAAAVLSFTWYAWSRILDPAERAFVQSRLLSVRRRGETSPPAPV
jgi:O-antigen/teichoic acid export membrane protein